MIGREQRMSGVEGVSWLIRRLRPRPLFDGRFDHPERVKRATAWIAVDQQLFSPYVVGLGCKIESAKYHCADHHIWRHFRPRTRNRYVQAHSGRLLFEGDRNAIAEGQITNSAEGPSCRSSMCPVFVASRAVVLRLSSSQGNGCARARAIAALSPARSVSPTIIVIACGPWS